MYKMLKTKKEDGTIVDVNNFLLRVVDNAFIPFDPANTDYQAYLKWVEEGNTPLPADEVK